MRLVLGIDGGGTNCRAALATMAGVVIGRGAGGPANIMTDLEGTRDSVIEAARNAFSDAGADFAGAAETGAVLGLAGANVADLGDRLAAMLPFRESACESDALIALHGALGEHDGAIAIIGTGSVFMVRHGGQSRAIGGWGFALSDLGSGARLGRELLEESLLAHDGIRTGTGLTRAVLERFDNDPRNVVRFAAGARPRDYGQFAPLVFEHAPVGDVTAERLLSRSVRQIEEALAALGLRDADRLCLLGGLAKQIAPRLSAPFKAFLAEPLADALGGAVALAVERYGETAVAR